MIAVYKKEIRQYFHSLLGYVFLAAFLAVSGYMFYSTNIVNQRANLGLVFNNMLVIVIFMVPVLTMRMYAEERKGKMEQLLLTSPVSIPGIVAGKYLAALSVFGIGLLLTLPYPVILLIWSDAGIWNMIGSYVAFLFVIAAFLAISTFLSSLTDSQVVAAVSSYTVLVFLWMVGSMYSSLTNPLLRSVAEHVSYYKTYSEFATGLFNPATVLYYLSTVFVFLFFTVRLIDKKRWS